VVGRGNYISGKRAAREKSALELAAEVGEEPDDERKTQAEHKASHDREIKCGVLAAIDDVAGKFSEAEGELSAEEQKSTDDDKEAAQEEKSAAEFAEMIHNASLEQTDVQE
jgi:hypothetical protein